MKKQNKIKTPAELNLVFSSSHSSSESLPSLTFLSISPSVPDCVSFLIQLTFNGSMIQITFPTTGFLLVDLFRVSLEKWSATSSALIYLDVLAIWSCIFLLELPNHHTFHPVLQMLLYSELPSHLISYLTTSVPWEHWLLTLAILLSFLSLLPSA